jgi:DNA mismatch endonuclease (patch repair protein)
MPDVFSKEKRNDIMSRIRSNNTGIEEIVFARLRKEKIYFQKNYKKNHGCLDIAVPSKKIAVFINGDFWHGYHFEEWGNRLSKKYWQEKIASNIARDRKNCRLLSKSGWFVINVWEHKIKNKTSKILDKIVFFVAKTRLKGLFEYPY